MGKNRRDCCASVSRSYDKLQHHKVSFVVVDVHPAPIDPSEHILTDAVNQECPCLSQSFRSPYSSIGARSLIKCNRLKAPRDPADNMRRMKAWLL